MRSFTMTWTPRWKRSWQNWVGCQHRLAPAEVQRFQLVYGAAACPTWARVRLARRRLRGVDQHHLGMRRRLATTSSGTSTTTMASTYAILRLSGAGPCMHVCTHRMRDAP